MKWILIETKLDVTEQQLNLMSAMKIHQPFENKGVEEEGERRLLIPMRSLPNRRIRPVYINTEVVNGASSSNIIESTLK